MECLQPPYPIGRVLLVMHDLDESVYFADWAMMLSPSLALGPGRTARALWGARPGVVHPCSEVTSDRRSSGIRSSLRA